MQFSSRESEIINEISKHVKAKMPPDCTAHDWPHVNRVLKLSQIIHETEGGNLFDITLIALTHDLFDHKFFNADEEEGRAKLLAILLDFEIEKKICEKVVRNVFGLSFSKSKQNLDLDIEGKIVQDADRIEALGAIGVARAFAYGGYKKRIMYSPNEKIEEGTTVEHFYEKLLLLYDLLNTKTAKEIAVDRNNFMKEFLNRLETEWGVK